MEEEAKALENFAKTSDAQAAIQPDPAAKQQQQPVTSATLLAAGAASATPGSDINEDETMEEDPSIVDSRSIYVGNVGFWFRCLSVLGVSMRASC